eukprot:comp19531_c0_seq1/m.22851 comp19531_c0_seq1/g.22851  ORF comp19531_c0_seq1/g.22851 comp19531_c0_seq1/m.22851 type:complete len:596 (-) comp19531_c0_seq1:17-1804(-)
MTDTLADALPKPPPRNTRAPSGPSDRVMRDRTAPKPVVDNITAPHLPSKRRQQSTPAAARIQSLSRNVRRRNTELIAGPKRTIRREKHNGQANTTGTIRVSKRDSRLAPKRPVRRSHVDPSAEKVVRRRKPRVDGEAQTVKRQNKRDQTTVVRKQVKERVKAVARKRAAVRLEREGAVNREEGRRVRKGQGDREYYWGVGGQVDILAPTARKSKRRKVDSDGEEEAPQAPDIRIKRRGRSKLPVVPPPANSAEIPQGFTYKEDWISPDLEKALIEYFRYRLHDGLPMGPPHPDPTDNTDPGSPPPTPDSVPGTPPNQTESGEGRNSDGNEHGSTEAQSTPAMAHMGGCGSLEPPRGAHGTPSRRISERLTTTPVVTGEGGLVGKRMGFAPYTLRDSHCLRALHCARGAGEPIRISEGRHGNNARFLVEEMETFMADLAEEIRAEFPGELRPPSLDYAQVNVIAMNDKHKHHHHRSSSTTSAPAAANTASPSDPTQPPPPLEKKPEDEGAMRYVGSRRKQVVLDYHRDHDELGDIAVVSLMGSCTLRLRKGGMEYSRTVKPGSLYLLRGASRLLWEHAVDDVEGERISIVYRSKRS